MKQLRILFVGSLFSCVAGPCGCSHQIYDWGTYEESIYDLYEGDLDLGGEIERLDAEIQESRNENRQVPPGKLAHLGFLQLKNGDVGAARRNFESEKALYPECSEFMDFMLKRARKK